MDMIITNMNSNMYNKKQLLIYFFIVNATFQIVNTRTLNYHNQDPDLVSLPDIPANETDDVTYLTLSHNSIYEIDPDSLQQYPLMQKLQLSHNLLVNFPNLTWVAETLL